MILVLFGLALLGFGCLLFINCLFCLLDNGLVLSFCVFRVVWFSCWVVCFRFGIVCLGAWGVSLCVFHLICVLLVADCFGWFGVTI